MSVPTIDTASLCRELSAGRPITVLDVRPTAQRTEWAIPDSVHIDAFEALWDGDPKALAEFKPAPGARVVAVCAAGRTSEIAAQQLRDRGIDALSLLGGMTAWSAAWNAADVPLPGSAAAIVQVRRTGKGCLSYVVLAGGEAAVVDPSVEPEVYLEIAKARGARIAAVLDTHIHADHLSRGRRLAEATGAKLYLPEQKRARYPFAALGDGARIALGPVAIEALKTPGHTLESVCYLVDGKALLSGDTLFLDAVGRPDLASASPAETRARAEALHASLARIAALPATTLVLPCHTSHPVPFDGRPIGAPLAEVKARTADLALERDAFVASVLKRIPATPPNHARIVELNEAGSFPPGDFCELEAGANRCAVSCA